MYEFLVVIGVGISAIQVVRISNANSGKLSAKTMKRLERLWKVAQVAMRERKYLPAEKALLTILKIDHKNAPAYNRLGILYAKQQNYDDAIECFEIASSIEPKASSLHNLGLIYYETGKLDKAALAFEHALEKEPMAARYIAYAKVQRAAENTKKMIESLEKAVELEPNPQTYKLLYEAYKEADRVEDANKIARRLQRVVKSPKPQKRVKRGKKVQI